MQIGDAAMVADLRRRGIRDERTLKAMASLERGAFVPAEHRREATGDHPLDIGFEQTISQPYIVAFMTCALGLSGTERVLEIGTGSGYQTALLALLAREVFSVERVPALSQLAQTRLDGLGIGHVQLKVGDGHHGWPEHAPFDAIVLTAAPDQVPAALVEQLAAPGGRLVGPVADLAGDQELVRLTKLGDGTVRTERLLPVRFVRMISGPPV